MTIFDAADTTPSLRRAGLRSPFGPDARLRLDDAARILDVLMLVAGRAATLLCADEYQRIGRLLELSQVVLRRAGAGESAAPVELGVSGALDLAAELLECADLLGVSGWSVGAFALEGIEGRLLEALLGAGPFGDGVIAGTGR